MAKTKKQTLKHVSFGEYKGNKLIQFNADNGDDEGDRYPFQFGAAKARRLLQALEVDGVDAVKSALKEVIEASK